MGSTQEKYSAFDRELFTYYMGIGHFVFMLGGPEVHDFADHKPHTYSLSSVTDPRIARKCRQLAYVVELSVGGITVLS